MMCNLSINSRFSILSMATRYERLLQAASELHGCKGPADAARLLQISDQVLTNWKNRDVPAKELLTVARIIGCDPFWLETGESEMVTGQLVRDENLKRLLAAAQGIPDYAVQEAIARIEGLMKMLQQVPAQALPPPADRRQIIKHGATDFEPRPDTGPRRRADDTKEGKAT